MELLYPEVLFIMLIPAVLLFYLVYSNKSQLNRVFEANSLNKLLGANSALSRNSRIILLFFALSFMIIAYSRPYIKLQDIEVEAKGVDIVIAIDISHSMKATDIFPNRFEASKKKAKEFLNLLSPSDKVAIMLFSAKTYLLSPLSIDKKSVGFMLDNFRTDGIDLKSTSIISALEAISNLLINSTTKKVLIITDGGDSVIFSKEITFAKDNSLEISILNIGTMEGSPINRGGEYIKDESGKIVISKLNPNIKELAVATKGVYVEFMNLNEDIEVIKNYLAKGRAIIDTKTIKDTKELFIYPLAVGIFFLFLSLISIPKKRNILSMLILFSFFNLDLKANIFDFLEIENAEKSYHDGNYSKSKEIYQNLLHDNPKDEIRMNLANSFYKMGEYEKAIKEYEAIKKEELEFSKLHNLGNSYAKLNKIDEAIKSYEKALKLKDDSDTKSNLELLKQLKEQQQQQEKQQQDEQKNENQEDKKEQEQQDSKEDKKGDEEKNSQKEDKKDENNKEESSQTEQKSEEIDLNKEENKEKLYQMLDGDNPPILLYQMPTKESYEKNPW